jgi:hypothetical protein
MTRVRGVRRVDSRPLSPSPVDKTVMRRMISAKRIQAVERTAPRRVK